MSHTCHARDTSHMHVKKLSCGFRADRPLGGLRCLPLRFDCGSDLSRHSPTKKISILGCGCGMFYKPSPNFRQTVPDWRTRGVRGRFSLRTWPAELKDIG